MSAAHTSGPWHYGHLGTEAFWVGPDYDQTPVAVVEHDTEHARDNSRANAALIAAAPDLLEALQVLVKFEGHHVYCGHGKDETKPCVCGFNKAGQAGRAAIAKARGQ